MTRQEGDTVSFPPHFSFFFFLPPPEGIRGSPTCPFMAGDSGPDNYFPASRICENQPLDNMADRLLDALSS